MKTITKHGNYEVVQYNEGLVTIDFSNPFVGVTVKAFSDKETAIKVFNEIVKPLTLRKAAVLNEDVRQSIVYSI